METMTLSERLSVKKRRILLSRGESNSNMGGKEKNSLLGIFPKGTTLISPPEEENLTPPYLREKEKKAGKFHPCNGR